MARHVELRRFDYDLPRLISDLRLSFLPGMTPVDWKELSPSDCRLGFQRVDSDGRDRAEVKILKFSETAFKILGTMDGRKTLSEVLRQSFDTNTPSVTDTVEFLSTNRHLFHPVT